jgi:hypothetical protein
LKPSNGLSRECEKAGAEIEYEDELEYEYDLRTRAIFEDPRERKSVLVGSFLIARKIVPQSSSSSFSSSAFSL